MISRRQIRVKVMQLFFEKRMKKEVSYDTLSNQYYKKVDDTFIILQYALFLIRKVAKYTLVDKKNRQTKLRPQDKDKVFRAVFYENEYLDSLYSSALEANFKKHLFHNMIDNDTVKLLYQEIADTEEFNALVFEGKNSKEDYIALYLKMVKYLSKSENYFEHLEDNFSAWVHDESLVVGALKKIIKSLPQQPDYLQDHLPEDAAVKDFGEELLYKVFHKEDELLKIIKPALQNWEAERVAFVDMILLKMAVAEMLYFPTIPTKVTINEYVEIAKLYSTQKSKDFINGVLDNLMKTLSSSGEIVKKGRGLIS